MSEQSIVQTGEGDEVEYREIPRFVGYRFGSDGSVWSCIKKGGALSQKTLCDQWHRLKPRPVTTRRPPGQGRRYYAVLIRAEGERKAKNRMVHHLILEAFVGPRPPGLVSCHGDGDPANNRLSNLRWDTPGANHEDMRRHGVLRQGSAKTGSKLREADIPVIHKLRAKGWRISRIARRFGVTGTIIIRVLKGEDWKHAQPVHIAKL